MTGTVTVIYRSPVMTGDIHALPLVTSLARELIRALAAAGALIGSAAILAHQIRAIRK